MGVYQRGDTWHIRVQYDGRDIRKAIGRSKRLAEKALASLKGEIVQGRFKLREMKRSPRFEEVVKEFLVWSRDHKRSWRRDTTLVLPLLRFFSGKRLREITRWLVDKYTHERLKAKVRNRPIAPATVNRELACLRRILNLAVEWGQAEANPAARFKRLQEPNHNGRILSEEEIQQLLTACRGHCYGMALLALHTGMRLGEILGLTRDRVDLSQATITLLHTKNGKVRRVPLNRIARQLLESWPRSGPYVFGGAKPYGSIKTAFRAACRRAGLGRFRFHDLRHTWATRLVLAGVDLRTVQDLGGWSSLALVERYSHPTPEAKRRAVRVLEELPLPARWHKTGTSGDVPVGARRLNSVQSTRAAV